MSGGKLIGRALSKSRTSSAILVFATALVANATVGGAQIDQPGKAKAPNQREAVGLNPQPEPPSRNKKKQKLKPAEMRGLNPQPEPPRPAVR